ncbi:MAG: sulfite exporter TauE/SafE family protein [Planctomycetota bacterium]|nr:MAG: sulfite exporter TauE/SafE family protein [Planctomycetota bacterium]
MGREGRGRSGVRPGPRRRGSTDRPAARPEHDRPGREDPAPVSARASLSPGRAVLLGLTAGLLSGLFGIGGGLVVGPALALAGLPLAVALGTSLSAVAPVAAAAAVVGLRTAPEQLAWFSALLVAVGGQVGAPLGARLIVALPERRLRQVFVLFLLLAAVRSLVGPPAGSGGGPAAFHPAAAAAATLLLGVLAGLTSSLFGVGGGVVVVPGLMFGVGGFSFRAAAATSLLAMIPTSALGAWLAARQGRIAAGVARWLVPAAVAAVVGAVVLRDRVVPPAALARGFGLFLFFAALRLLRPPAPAGGADSRSGS